MEDTKLGRWISDGNRKECSECGFVYYSVRPDFKFCPECGKQMHTYDSRCKKTKFEEMNMTDEQIVKALELESMPSEMNCIYGRYIEACGIYCDKKNCYAENCAECTEHRMGYGGNRAKVILALIKRQQAEIDHLREATKKAEAELSRYKNSCDECLEWRVSYSTVRAEAVREFAEKLKKWKYQSSDWSHGEHPFVVEETDIDELVIEMTEKEGGKK